jgi:hypothetical protein
MAKFDKTTHQYTSANLLNGTFNLNDRSNDWEELHDEYNSYRNNITQRNKHTQVRQETKNLWCSKLRIYIDIKDVQSIIIEYGFGYKYVIVPRIIPGSKLRAIIRVNPILETVDWSQPQSAVIHKCHEFKFGYCSELPTDDGSSMLLNESTIFGVEKSFSKFQSKCHPLGVHQNSKSLTIDHHGPFYDCEIRPFPGTYSSKIVSFQQVQPLWCGVGIRCMNQSHEIKRNKPSTLQLFWFDSSTF